MIQKAFNYIVGRLAAPEIRIDDWATFMQYLDQNAVRVERRLDFHPIFSNSPVKKGLCFFEGPGWIIIRYNSGLNIFLGLGFGGASYYVGSLFAGDNGMQLRGYFKSPAFVEFFRILIFGLLIFWALSFPYWALTGNSVSLVDIVIWIFGLLGLWIAMRWSGTVMSWTSVINTKNHVNDLVSGYRTG